jgi:hypothetical protein
MAWFDRRECRLIECAIRTIAEVKNMDEEDLLSALGLPYVHPLEQMYYKHPIYDVSMCHTILDSKTNTQCKKSRIENSKFCKYHAKHQLSNPNPKVIINDFEMDKALQQYREYKKDTKLFRMQLIVRNDTDYLYDPYTQYIYDFDTVKRVGRVHSNGELYFENTSTLEHESSSRKS